MTHSRVFQLTATKNLNFRLAHVQLGKYRDQLKKLKPGPTRKQVEGRAMQVLKQKRMYEKQRDQVSGQVFNIDQAKFAQVRAREMVDTCVGKFASPRSSCLPACSRSSGVHQGLDRHGAGHEGHHGCDEIADGRVRYRRHRRHGSQCLHQDLNLYQDNNFTVHPLCRFSVPFPSRLQHDDMEDLMLDTDEMNEILGRSYGVPENIDEEDLAAELNALDDELASEAVEEEPDYLKAPAPREVIAASSTSASQRAPVVAAVSSVASSSSGSGGARGGGGGGGGLLISDLPAAPSNQRSLLPSAPQLQPVQQVRIGQ